ncbi:MAG: glycosyltransferase family 4 protein [Pyrinomonadaceae bacterium]
MSTETSARKRLWVVSELYYPEETSTGYYLTRIAEGLADKFEVKAISGQPNYSARGVRAPKRELRNDVEIFRAAGTTLDKNIIAFRLINMLTLGASVLFTALRRFRAGDRVLVVTNPPAMPFIVAIASLLRGSVYSLLIHDNYPEILIAAEKVKQGSMTARFLQFLNRWLYKHTSRIIVVGRDMQELVSRKTAGLDVPITVIPNWAELETVSPAPRAGNALLAELGLERKFVLLYAGNIGPPNDIESIVRAAELLLPEKQYHFVFLGSGVKRPYLTREAKARSLENLTILDPRPRSEQIVFLNACDVSLVSLVSKMRGVSMPSRTYNILAAGKPIIGVTEPGSEVDRIIEEEGVGWNVPPGEPDQLVAVIRQAYSGQGTLAEMGRRARTAAETKYSLETAIAKYRDAIA